MNKIYRITTEIFFISRNLSTKNISLNMPLSKCKKGKKVKPASLKGLRVKSAKQLKKTEKNTQEQQVESFTDNLDNMYKNILINGLPTKALIDTGSYNTRIRSDCAEHLMLNVRSLKTDIGESDSIVAEVTVDIEIDEVTFTDVDCYIITSRKSIEPEVIIGSKVVSAAHVTITPDGVTFHPTDGMKKIYGKDSALPSTHVQELKVPEEASKCEVSEKINKKNPHYSPKNYNQKLENLPLASDDSFGLISNNMTKFVIINYYLAIDAFIDTGSSVSLIADNYLKFLPIEYEIQPFRLLINNTITSYGYITVRLQIDEIVFENVKLFILDARLIKDEVIIGADVINQAKVTISSNEIAFSKLQEGEAC